MLLNKTILLDIQLEEDTAFKDIETTFMIDSDYGPKTFTYMSVF